MNPKMTMIYRQRLLNVVKALRETSRPERFDMGRWGGFCGTPACAIGHYAARRDLQRTFSLSFWRGKLKVRGDRPAYPEISTHFGITDMEATELFGTRGCLDAQTVDEAIPYIEAFVERKFPIAQDSSYKKFREELVRDGVID